MTSYFTNKETPMSTTEPVALGGAIQALLAALISAALLFGWVNWSDAQVGGIMAVYTALVAVVTTVQRSKVTPVP